MAIRHVTSTDNVDDEGFLIDPTRAHHGTIQAAHVEDLGGPVDPLTHLNRDFPDHELGECVVAERLAVGAPVVWSGDGTFQRAIVRPGAMSPLGRVDTGERRIIWLQVLQERRNGARNVGR